MGLRCNLDPDLAARVRAKELSAYAGAIEAGFRNRPDGLENVALSLFPVCTFWKVCYGSSPINTGFPAGENDGDQGP